MKLVCITGIDGAGKTTLARYLARELTRRDCPAVYLYGRTFPILSRLVMALGRRLFLRRSDPWSDYATYSQSKVQKMQHPLLAWGYTAAVLLDCYAQIWIKLLPYWPRGQMVILDRYVYDTVISDISVHLSFSDHQTVRAVELALKYAPRPLLSMLIDLPVEVAYARKDDVPHLDYLHERQHHYRLLEHRAEFARLDGQHSPGELAAAAMLQIQLAASKSQDSGLA